MSLWSGIKSLGTDVVDSMNRAMRREFQSFMYTPRISRKKGAWSRGSVEKLLTPVKKPCLFLGMRTRESTISGLPQGVTQTCTHPAHGELELLQTNVSEILIFLKTFTEGWEIRNSPQIHNIIIPADASALELDNPAEFTPPQTTKQVAEMREFCKELSDRLLESLKTQKGFSNNKAFTDVTKKSQ